MALTASESVAHVANQITTVLKGANIYIGDSRPSERRRDLRCRVFSGRYDDTNAGFHVSVQKGDEGLCVLMSEPDVKKAGEIHAFMAKEKHGKVETYLNAKNFVYDREEKGWKIWRGE